MSDELPIGWKIGRLADVVGPDGLFTDGDWVESKDQDPHGDVRLIQLADVGDGYYRDRSDRFLTLAKARDLQCSFLKIGDLLIARMPDPLGRACIFPSDSKPSVTVVDVCIIRTVTDAANHRWLMYVINSPSIRRVISSLQKGTTRKRISRKNLATIALPVAPLNEQRRIVQKIEELFSKLDAGVAALERVKANLKRYRAAVLKAAVEGKLTGKRTNGTRVAKNWIEVGDVLTCIEQGWSPKCEREPATADDDWAVMKTSAILPMKYLDFENKKLPNRLRPRRDLVVNAGDLLITRAGPRNRAAVTCLVRSTRGRLIVCDKVYRMRTDPTKAVAAYLEVVLNSPTIVDKLDSL